MLAFACACSSTAPETKSLAATMGGAPVGSGAFLETQPPASVLERAEAAANAGRPSDPSVARFLVRLPDLPNALDVEVLVYSEATEEDARELWDRLPPAMAYASVATNFAEHSPEFIDQHIEHWRLPGLGVSDASSMICLASTAPVDPNSPCEEAAVWILLCDTVLEVTVGSSGSFDLSSDRARELFGEVTALAGSAVGACRPAGTDAQAASPPPMQQQGPRGDSRGGG